MSKEIGITVRKSQDFSEWYTQVVLKSELADYAPTKGFMVLRPYGYALWERIRTLLDRRFKATGHQNAYFPLVIPESLLTKEAEHFKGFTPEVFWITHAGDEALAEKLATRPTSETIAYALYAKWIRSWRDLPLLLNFWNSVLRAEIKSTKPFIRTSEFLWQEGHTVHATKEEADAEVLRMLNIYRQVIERELALPTRVGTKTEKEKFVGALYTTTLESLMLDGKILQMGTSHNLGQNFSIPFEIKYLGKDGNEHFAWQTSWGVSWRLIGATIMVHGDDRGLVLPPRVAPTQVVIVPIFYSREDEAKVTKKARSLAKALRIKRLRIFVDDKAEYTPGWKFHEWELKGVPLRLEVGPKDIMRKKVVLVRRDTLQRRSVPENALAQEVIVTLREIQTDLYRRAEEYLTDHISTAKTFDELKGTLESKGGFVRASWCGTRLCEDRIKEETGADIRFLPFKQEEPFAPCVLCGEEAKQVAYFGRAY